jgi:GntR family phosphonate transport system transcriptional regulator
MAILRKKDEPDGVPIYVRLAEELEGAILRGDYAPHDRLPPERDLAEEHGINRHTARQALGRLQSMGLVYRVRGRGTFVRSERVEYRVAEKMSFSDSVRRMGLQPRTEPLAVRRIGAYGRAVEGLMVPAGEPLVAYERLRYAGKVPIVYGTKHFREALFPGIHEHLSRKHGSVRQLVRDRYGQDLYRARSVVEIEPSDAVTARYLGLPLGAPLLRTESTDALEDGTPAEWGVSYFRGDATRLDIRIRRPRGAED